MNMSDIINVLNKDAINDLREKQLMSLQKLQMPDYNMQFSGVVGMPGLNPLILKEREEMKANARKPLSEVLDEITMFRYGYVPFVIAELVWDYADTVIDMATLVSDPKTKKLSRAVRELRREYERYHDIVVDKDGKSNEESNMYAFEDEVSKIFSLYITNVKCDLAREYDQIEENTMGLLVAVYMCLLLIKSLLRYSAVQTEKASAMAGYKVIDVMPRQVHSLATLIAEFAGDMPVSKGFKDIQETYVKTFVTQISLIELNITDQ